jgi:hypothetical protein
MSTEKPSPDTGATGGCACGGVRYRIDGELRGIVHCHCEPCRRITGHHMAATAAIRSDLHLEYDVWLRWYQRTETVRYGFCSRCGGTLFWEAADKDDRVSIAAGTLDQPTGLQTVLAIYAGDAGDYHHLDPTIETHDGDRSVDHWSNADSGAGGA